MIDLSGGISESWDLKKMTQSGKFKSIINIYQLIYISNIR